MSMGVFIILNCTFIRNNSHAAVLKKSLLYNQILIASRLFLFFVFFPNSEKIFSPFSQFCEGARNISETRSIKNGVKKVQRFWFMK
jgi:hypothetical protein